MSEPAAWIDITAHDAKRARTFYGDLLGWSFVVVETTLARAAQLGGSVVMPPWTVPGTGTMAVALDPEGNRVGLWTRPPQKSGSRA